MPIPPLIQKVDNNIASQQLLKEGQIVLVCVSGGSDSMALLHILLELQNKWKYKLHLLHFDHGLRTESLVERQFIESLAQEYELPCHKFISTHLSQETAGIQEKSRQWRMQISEKIRVEIGAQRIATAHHADDQTETFLLKLLRGCHLSNLRGMDWQSGFYIRPLLNCTKSELQQYLKNKSQIWMEDTSNQSSQYLRNRIRMELIPLMDEFARGELYSRLQDLSEQSEQLKHWIEQSKEGLKLGPMDLREGLLIAPLIQAPQMVQSTLLFQYLTAQEVRNLDYIHIQQILRLLQTPKNQWEFHLPGKKIIRREGEKLFVSSLSTPHLQTFFCNSIEFTNRLEPEWQIQCQILDHNNIAPLEGLTLFNIHPTNHLTLRYRKSGDRFHPHWRPKPVKLKDFLRDQGIPLHQRNRIPLICQGDNILAIYPQYRALSSHYDQKKYAPLHIRLGLKGEK